MRGSGRDKHRVCRGRVPDRAQGSANRPSRTDGPRPEPCGECIVDMRKQNGRCAIKRRVETAFFRIKNLLRVSSVDHSGRLPSSRRGFLLNSAWFSLALAGGTAWPALLRAQEAQEQAEAEDGQAFSFDALSEAMREKAGRPFEPAQEASLPEELGELDYDAYRQIQYRPDRAKWAEAGSLFRVHAFHLGWLYREPVHIHEVADGVARRIGFSTADFAYRGTLAGTVPDETALPGVAGFRINYPLNRPDLHDELVAFVGASYFRAVGRGNFYGLSARGLAINTGLSGEEEFPRFSDFYLERQPAGSQSVVVNAALESQSVTGAFRFVIHPGRETVMEVTARLFFRADVAQVGIAPMTSMFLYAANNRSRFDDYRPQVHDSNGLRVVRRGGDVLWRALNNPPRLATSYFSETDPLSFGLHQRDRDFASYQDSEAHYELRPSLDVEPIGEWGEGSVRLVEIPSEVEVNDNIVAFWVPEASPVAGEEREYRYRLRWGDLDPDPAAGRAHVLETRTGHGGVSGIENAPDLRKFVVDFKGGMLGRLPADADVEVATSVSGGELVHAALSKIGGTDIWRLVMDVRVTSGQLIEMVAHVNGYEQRLSETWLYQWIPT